jgi:hypothetical protein
MNIANDLSAIDPVVRARTAHFRVTCNSLIFRPEGIEGFGRSPDRGIDEAIAAIVNG